jgi:hypothetical protein
LRGDRVVVSAHPAVNGRPYGILDAIEKEGGTRIAVDFVLTDPECLVRPMIHARELIYTPQIEMTPFDCDPDATRMFMRTSD